MKTGPHWVQVRRTSSAGVLSRPVLDFPDEGSLSLCFVKSQRPAVWQEENAVPLRRNEEGNELWWLQYQSDIHVFPDSSRAVGAAFCRTELPGRCPWTVSLYPFHKKPSLASSTVSDPSAPLLKGIWNLGGRASTHFGREVHETKA